MSGPTRGQAKGPGWRQTSYGLYVTTTVDEGKVEQRILEQSMRLGPEGAVTGWAACRMRGAAFFDGLARDGETLLPVPLVDPARQLRADQHSRTSRDRIGPDEITAVNGVRCAVSVRAVFDAAREAPDLREAVVAIDMAAAARITSLNRLRCYIAQRRRWRNVRQVERALALAHERSRSPSETRMRLIWLLDAGLPPPLVNRAVFTRSGAFLGIGDLVDPEAAVFGEYDGADHRSVQRHTADLSREHRCRRNNLDFFRITGPGLRRIPETVERMVAARERGLRRDRSRDTWTLELPDWWEEELSMDEEEALSRIIHQQLPGEA